MSEEQLDARGRPRSLYQTINEGPELTVQSDHDKADIRKILKKYREVGIVDNLNATQAQFQDITAFTDYADVMRTAKQAEMEFMKLPSKVREVFNHDVATWLDTAHDQEKRASLAETGEIKSVEQPAPIDTGDGPE